MYYFGVYYQGRHSGLTKQERFLANYDDIVKLVRPLDGTTIFCSWDAKAIRGVYDRVKRIYDGSSMAAAKTLYFFVPDLFVILDRKQVWNEWRAECPFLPKSISRVSGADCVAILQHVRKKIMVAIREGIPFTLGHSLSSAVKTVDALRLLYPLQVHQPEKIGHTLSKVIDNIIRNTAPGNTEPASSCTPPLDGGDE